MARLKYHQTILKILGDDHLTADDIYDIMKKKYGRIGIATIYRTLDYLIESGEITKLVGVFDKAYFEKNKGPHMHFIDKQLHKIIDVSVKDYSFLPKQEGFSISYADIIVYGSLGDGVATGLFSPHQGNVGNVIVSEKTNQSDNVVINDILNTTSLDEVEEHLFDDQNQEKKPIVEDMADQNTLEVPTVSEIQSDAANSVNSLENITSQDDVERKQEEEKKKRKELKSIFRQF